MLATCSLSRAACANSPPAHLLSVHPAGIAVTLLFAFCVIICIRPNYNHLHPAGIAVTLLFAFCVIYVAADFRYPLPTPFPGDCCGSAGCTGELAGMGSALVALCDMGSSLHGGCTGTCTAVALGGELHQLLSTNGARALASLFLLQRTPWASAWRAPTSRATRPSLSCPPPSSPPPCSPRPCGSAPGPPPTASEWWSEREALLGWITAGCGWAGHMGGNVAACTSNLRRRAQLDYLASLFRVLQGCACYPHPRAPSHGTQSAPPCPSPFLTVPQGAAQGLHPGLHRHRAGGVLRGAVRHPGGLGRPDHRHHRLQPLLLRGELMLPLKSGC